MRRDHKARLAVLQKTGVREQKSGASYKAQRTAAQPLPPFASLQSIARKRTDHSPPARGPLHRQRTTDNGQPTTGNSSLAAGNSYALSGLTSSVLERSGLVSPPYP